MRGLIEVRRRGTVLAVAAAVLAGTAERAAADEPAPLPAAERWRLLSPELDPARTVVVDPDGTAAYVVAVRNADRWTNDLDTEVLALDPRTGAERWRAGFASELRDWDLPAAAALSPDGDLLHVAIATKEPEQTIRWRVVAFRTDTGARVWVSRYESADPARGHYDAPAQLLVAPDGRVIVSGTSSALRRTPNQAIDVAAFDGRTGRELWRSSVHDGRSVSSAAAALSPDGRDLYVTGLAEEQEDQQGDVALFALDTSTGATRWRQSDGRRDQVDEPADVVVAPDGASVFVVGTTGARTTAEADGLALAYDRAGTQRWRRTWSAEGPAFDRAVAAGVGLRGEVLHITGASSVETTGPTAARWSTRALGARTGEPLWAAHHSAGAGGFDAPTDLAVSKDDTVVVTGYESAGQGERIRTIAYNGLTGIALSTATHRSAADHLDVRPADVEVSADGGTAFVVGQDRLRSIVLAYCLPALPPSAGC